MYEVKKIIYIEHFNVEKLNDAITFQNEVITKQTEQECNENNINYFLRRNFD